MTTFAETAPASEPRTTVAPGGRRRIRFRPEIALLVAGMLPAIIVYVLHWRRGYFLDDPFMDSLSLPELWDSVVVMRARPLGTILVAVSYLIGEPAGRALAAVCLGAVAVLAALLVRRLCGGRYAPVVAAIFVVYPVVDWESALYWYAAIQYPAGAAFGLAGGHAVLTTLRARTRRGAVGAGLGAAALFALALACTETAVNFLLLAPGILFVETVRHRRVERSAVGRAAAVTAASAVALGLLGAFIYLPQNDFTSARGEFISHPVEAGSRLVNFWFPAVKGLTLGPERLAIHREALRLGVDRAASPAAVVVLAAAVGLGAYAVWASVRQQRRPRSTDRSGVRAAVAVAVVGLAIAAVAAWFPAGLLSGQGPVVRLLFAPWVGLVLVLAALVAAVEAGGRRRLVPLVVAPVVPVALVLAMTIDGYGAFFRLRDLRNDEQLAAWVGVTEAAEPLPGDARLVSLYGRDQLLGRPSPVDDTFAGITETPWALTRSIGDVRGREIASLGGHPFIPVCFARTVDPAALRVTTFFNDEVIPAASILAAEVRNGSLAIVEKIRFRDEVVELPLGRRADAAAERLSLETEGDRVCTSFGRQAP